jgi:OmpA-OmpF porin, OOP family
MAAMGLYCVASTLQAQPAANSGYLTDPRGDLVRNATYLCWHTGYWTPAAAVAECDPDLVPKPAPVAVAPTPPQPPARAQPAVPAPKPSPPPAPVMRKVTLSAETLFDFDKSVIKPQGRRRLDELAGNLASMDIDAIIAVGHTDSVGSDAYNERLSIRRARAVKAYLVSKGVPGARVSAEGRGEKQPVASNKTRDGRAKNRRVEIEIVGTRR